MPFRRRSKEQGPQLPSKQLLRSLTKTHGPQGLLADIEARIAFDRGWSAYAKLEGLEGGERGVAALAEALTAVLELATVLDALDQALIEGSAGALTGTLLLQVDSQFNYTLAQESYVIHDYGSVLSDHDAAVDYAKARSSPEREWFLMMLARRRETMRSLHDAVERTVGIADKISWLAAAGKASEIDAELGEVDADTAFSDMASSGEAAGSLAAEIESRYPEPVLAGGAEQFRVRPSALAERATSPPLADLGSAPPAAASAAEQPELDGV